MEDVNHGMAAGAALMQREGEEISAIVLNMVQAAADRAGEPLSLHHMTEAIGLMLSAAWTFAKLADADHDGGRAARYADLLRRHADAVEDAQL